MTFPTEAEYNVRKVRVDDEADFERAVQVMISSFSIMPSWSAFYRHPNDPRARAKVLYYLRAVAELGEVWCIEGGSDGFMESVIGFNPPGRVYSDASTVKNDGKAFYDTLGSDRIQRGGESVMTYDDSTYNFESIERESYNITLVGTRPSALGKGLASRLIRTIHDQADKEGKGVWVPTTYKPRIRFYEKMGFVHIRSMDMISDLGQPMNEYMLYRPPQILNEGVDDQDND